MARPLSSFPTAAESEAAVLDVVRLEIAEKNGWRYLETLHPDDALRTLGLLIVEGGGDPTEEFGRQVFGRVGRQLGVG